MIIGAIEQAANARSAQVIFCGRLSTPHDHANCCRREGAARAGDAAKPGQASARHRRLIRARRREPVFWPSGYRTRIFSPLGENGAGGADCESEDVAAVARSAASTATRSVQNSSSACLSSSSEGCGGFERKDQRKATARALPIINANIVSKPNSNSRPDMTHTPKSPHEHCSSPQE